MLFGGIIERDRSGLPRKEDLVMRQSDRISPVFGKTMIIERSVHNGYEYAVIMDKDGALDGYVGLPEGFRGTETLGNMFNREISEVTCDLLRSGISYAAFRYPVSFRTYRNPAGQPIYRSPQLDAAGCADSCRRLIDLIPMVDVTLKKYGDICCSEG